ncbi:PAS domain S-box protein [Chloroflexota bacterium]
MTQPSGLRLGNARVQSWQKHYRLASLTRAIRRPGFWLLVSLLVLITTLHYGETLERLAFITRLMASLSLEHHAFERILYLVPIIWAGFLYERRGVLIVSLAALTCMLPLAIFISPHPEDAFFEAGAVFIVGNLVAFAFNLLRKERERRTQLAAINETSSVVSQSLELNQILNSSIDKVVDVLSANAAVVFLVDEQADELTLAACKGVTEELTQGVGKFKVGEGSNSRVAETGEPLFVQDAFGDPSLARMVVEGENMCSALIAPLKSKGEVKGTLCVITHSHRRFRQDEVELLRAIGNQIAVAVDNARLYEQAWQVTEQLATSEERYRELFENASDAIWVHDLQENIITANKSMFRLTGYTLAELREIRARDLIAEGCAASEKAIEDPLLRGEAIGRLLELTLVKKDKSEAWVQFSTSPVFSNGQIVAFQHVARDVTEDKWMKENMRFYLHEVTRAQEEERQRIARELHDETIQALIVLSRQLDELASSGKGLSKEQSSLLESLRDQTNGIMEDVRRLSQDLRPATLDRLGLLPALEWLASDVERHSGIAVEVKAHGAQRRLPAEVELVLFRIAQESLTNVWRHSQATRAEVMVDFDERLTRMTVSDNGRGFDLLERIGDLVKKGRLGLVGMQERAQLLSGNLKIESKPGKGTTVMIEAPT